MLSRSLLALLPALLAPVALAQNSSANASASYVPGLLAALTELNLTSLAGAAEGLANTTLGLGLLGSLPMGNKTVFAPSNDAFAAVPANVSSNLNLLGETLQYHILAGAFPASSFMMSPNHIVARTFLNESSLVQLEANKSQVVVASNMGGHVMILNQPQNVTVINSSSYMNLVIHIIDAVLTIPPMLTDALSTAGLSSLTSAVEMTNLTEPLMEAHGITIFAPNNAAFTTALAALGSSANATVIGNVLGNHVINGTTLYSSSLMPGMNYTTASGEPLSVMANSTGMYVMSASSTAMITQSDILISNGVVHLIDAVLVNAMANPAAASSAYMSATSAAAMQTAPETGPVGMPTSTMASSAASSSAAAKSGAVVAHPAFSAVVMSLGVVFVGAALGAMIVV